MTAVTNHRWFSATLFLLSVWPGHSLEAQKSRDQGFKAALYGLTPAADSPVMTGIPGVDGWLFFGPELQYLKNCTGTTNGCPKALDAIVDFNNQLQKAGVFLLVVPVPPKAAIYPDKLSSGLQPPVTPPFPALSEFCAKLRTNGVQALDLAEAFQTNRDKGDPLYCKTDSHWSPEGIRIASSEIVRNLQRLLVQPISSSVTMTNSEQALEFRGDLALPETTPERVLLRSVSSEGHPIAVSRTSPVLLLGDSHNLVFHSGGDMHAVGAGLPDQLALELGFPVDLVAVMGSGATAARWSLARRHDNLAGKKAVIWCFTARDLTEGRWDKVPVIRPSDPQATPALSP